MITNVEKLIALQKAFAERAGVPPQGAPPAPADKSAITGNIEGAAAAKEAPLPKLYGTAGTWKPAPPGSRSGTIAGGLAMALQDMYNTRVKQSEIELDREIKRRDAEALEKRQLASEERAEKRQIASEGRAEGREIRKEDRAIQHKADDPETQIRIAKALLELDIKDYQFKKLQAGGTTGGGSKAPQLNVSTLTDEQLTKLGYDTPEKLAGFRSLSAKGQEAELKQTLGGKPTKTQQPTPEYTDEQLRGAGYDPATFRALPDDQRRRAGLDIARVPKKPEEKKPAGGGVREILSIRDALKESADMGDPQAQAAVKAIEAKLITNVLGGGQAAPPPEAGVAPAQPRAGQPTFDQKMAALEMLKKQAAQQKNTTNFLQGGNVPTPAPNRQQFVDPKTGLPFQFAPEPNPYNLLPQ